MSIDRTVYVFQDFVDKAKTYIGIKSTKLTNFGEGSNLLSTIEAFAHFIEYLQLRVNNAIEGFSFNTAHGDDLKTRAKDFNVIAKVATAATCPIVLQKTTPAGASFSVYAGSQVSTQPDAFGNTVSYTLDNTLSFPSGAIQVTGSVTCTITGIAGNSASGTITNITGSLPGIDTVTNPIAASDGSDDETDQQIKQRIPITMNGLKSGNESAIQAAVYAIPGITVVRVVENVPALGQVTVYVSNQSGTLSAAQLAAVQLAADTEKAFGIVANVVTPTVIYVTLQFTVEYDSTNYLATAGVPTVIDLNLKTAINTFISNNPSTTLKLWDLQQLASLTSGVLNFSNLTINSVASDYTNDGFNVIRILDQDNSIAITYVAR